MKLVGAVVDLHKSHVTHLVQTGQLRLWGGSGIGLTLKNSEERPLVSAGGSESLLIKYEMHPTVKTLVVGEYDTETSLKVTGKGGVAQTITTASKFSITEKSKGEPDDDDAKEEEED